MEIITQLFDTAWMQALGWTLMHSLWQGVVLALILALALLILKKHSAQVRYLAGIGTLLVLLVSMIVTFNMIYEPAYAKSSPTQEEWSVGTEPIATATYADGIKISPKSEKGNGILLTYLHQYFEQHLPLIIFFYLIGVLILTMQMLGELVFIQTLKHSRSRFVSDPWQDKLNALVQKAGIRKAVQLKESTKITSPMITGILKPVIFIPVGLLSNLSASQVESVLAHELAHIRRHDYLVNLLQSLAEILLFFNPAVWWISSFIRSEREHCCDDIAIQMTGDEFSFIKTLAKLEEWRMQHNSLAVAFSGNRRGGVLARIQRLVNHETSVQLPFRLFWGTAILLIGITLSAFSTYTPFQEPDYRQMEKHILDENRDTIPLPDTKTTAPLIASPETTASGIRANEKPLIATSPLTLKNSKGLAEEPNGLVGLASVRPAVEGIGSTTGPVSVSPTTLTGTRPGMPDLISNDTVPEQIKKLEAEIRALQNQFKPRRLALEKQFRELEERKHSIQKATNEQLIKEQLNQQEAHYEIQKMENDMALKQREIEMALHDRQSAIMELEHKVHELELQKELKEQEINDENEQQINTEIKQLNEQVQRILKEKMKAEQDINRQEMDIRKEALEQERRMQEIQNKNELKEHNLQKQELEAQLKMVKIEEEARMLELQMQELQHQQELKINELSNKIEQAYRSMEREEY